MASLGSLILTFLPAPGLRMASHFTARKSHTHHRAGSPPPGLHRRRGSVAGLRIRHLLSDQPEHLIAVAARANRSKGSKGPDQWKPEDRTVKGGEKVYHCGGGIVYHRQDEKEPIWEPGGVRSGVRRSEVNQESSRSSETSWAALCRLWRRR